MALTKAKLIEQLDAGDYDAHLPSGSSGDITTSTGTDITGILKGDGSNVGAAVDGTDYQKPLSAANILTLVKTVDGTGSGLDADTVDGLEGRQIAKINHGYAKDGGTTKDITFSEAGYYLIAVTHNSTAATRGLYIANVVASGVKAAYALVSGANLTVSVPSTWVVRIASSSGTPEVWPVRIS